MPSASPDKKYHFISGLPRSGSTLLAAVLRQNARFYANISSPLGELISTNIDLMSAGTEVSVLTDDVQRRQILRGLFDSYYTDREEPVIFDTNRAWTANLPALMQVFPDASRRLK